VQRTTFVLALLLVACAGATGPGRDDVPAHCADFDTEGGTRIVTPDAIPRPVGLEGIYFPDHLRRSPVEGTAVVEIELAEDGEVVSATVVERDLPEEFGPFLEREVETWRFTEPTVNGGCPIKARARMNIPVAVR